MPTAADLPEAFYLPKGDAFEATVLTLGPWHDRFQHGGPPAALERFGDGDFARSAQSLVVTVR